MVAAFSLDGIEVQVRGLPPRQAEALAHTVRGLNSKQTAKIMRISPRTVETHLKLAMAPLGAENRMQLFAFAVASGLLTISRKAKASTVALFLASALSIITPADSPDDYGRLAQRSLRVRTRRGNQRDSLDYLFADA